MTPLETAQAALKAAEAHVQELEHDQHRLDQERGAARAAGDNPLHAQLNDQVSASNGELRIARAAIEEARIGVRREQQRISRARSKAADLANRERWLAREAPEAMARAQALETELAEVKTKRAEAQQLLAQLESPEQPVAAPELAPAPAPVEREPEPERPYRIVGVFGSQARYYNRAGEETDAQSRPLVLLGETITDSADERPVG
jgi:chromosome segregation ATPase